MHACLRSLVLGENAYINAFEELLSAFPDECRYSRWRWRKRHNVQFRREPRNAMTRLHEIPRSAGRRGQCKLRSLPERQH